MSRLKTTLNEASKEERRSCVRSAREACKIVCNIVAPKAGDDLLRSVGTLDSEITVSKNLEELMSGYRRTFKFYQNTDSELICKLVSGENPYETPRKIRKNHRMAS